MIFLLRILFYALSNDISKFCEVSSSSLVSRHESVLNDIFPSENYELYFPQKLLKIALDM